MDSATRTERGGRGSEGDLLEPSGGLARKLNTRARGISFILEHAAYSMNHLSQGADRKVPYERGRGKKQTVVGVVLEWYWMCFMWYWMLF